MVFIKQFVCSTSEVHPIFIRRVSFVIFRTPTIPIRWTEVHTIPHVVWWPFVGANSKTSCNWITRTRAVVIIECFPGPHTNECPTHILHYNLNLRFSGRHIRFYPVDFGVGRRNFGLHRRYFRVGCVCSFYHLDHFIFDFGHFLRGKVVHFVDSFNVFFDVSNVFFHFDPSLR